MKYLLQIINYFKKNRKNMTNKIILQNMFVLHTTTLNTKYMSYIKKTKNGISKNYRSLNSNNQ